MGLSERMRALVRPEVAAMEPYDPAFVPCQVNLSANENTWPLPPAFTGAVRQALAQAPLNRYPDPLANQLRDELARWHGVSREQVLVGDGGDELLFLLFLAFGGPGRTLAVAPPTFSVYEIYARMLGTQVREVWRDPVTMTPLVWQLEQAAAECDLVAVTSPNNPTGDLFPLGGTQRLLSRCPGLVLVDEAYQEFADPAASALPLLREHDNLVLLRTLSKAFGMAGVRAGYLIAAPDVVAALSAVRQPYSVGVLQQAAALAAVAHRAEALQVVDGIKEERGRLAGRLAELGAQVWPSEANFLLVRVPEAGRVRRALAERWSVLVRDFSSAPGLRDCLRVTVGTPEENDRLVQALASELAAAQAQG